MGRMKELMFEQEAQLEEAIAICITAGILKRCEIHEEVYDALAGEDDAAYRLANHRFSQGEIKTFIDRREMTDTIQSVMSEFGDECGYCAKNARE